MPTINLTERAIAKLPAPDPSGKQTLYWDTDVRGFAVLCSGKTKTKTFVVQRTMPNGKDRRVTVGAVNELTLEKAKAEAADLLHDMRHGRDPKKKAANPTLGETLEEYLRARGPDRQNALRPASVYLYRQIERTLADWMDRPLREITGDMVEKRHIQIKGEVTGKNGRYKGDDRYKGDVTANVTMRTFCTLYNFAIDRGVADLPPNPASRLRRQWFKEKPKTRMVPEEKMAEFFDAVCALEHYVQRDFLLMLMFTGMRRGECASLRWDDVDLAKRTIGVQEENTKTGSKLELPMSDFVHALLVKRRSMGNSGFVFPGKVQGKPITSMTAPLRIVHKATGVLVSAHDLRRGFITIAESTEISVMALKALVNHSLGRGITEGYVQMKVERLREPAQRVANRIKELCGIVDVAGDNVKKLARP